MPLRTDILLVILTLFTACNSNAIDVQPDNKPRFSIEKDLLLLHYDCKTDVDDLQSVAGFATLISQPEYSGLRHHAVAGAYGIQEGLYVPPNPLFQLAFGNNWTDAHENSEAAVQQVLTIVKTTLAAEGDIWIAEAGQSDFSAQLINAIQSELPDIITSKRIHLVQHSRWNENTTSPESLEFVKKNADYHRIPDGNVVGNGTPGFRSHEFKDWENKISDPNLKDIWQLAVDISNEYNGKEGRYNNEAIAAGGLDFSDLSEVCWILGIEDIRDTVQFFELYGH